MLRVFIRATPRARWRMIDGGPFPISPEALTEARARYADEVARAGDDTFAGIRLAPQTAAREIIREVAPTLHDFDVLLLGFAVTSACVRFEEESEWQV